MPPKGADVVYLQYGFANSFTKSAPAPAHHISQKSKIFASFSSRRSLGRYRADIVFFNISLRKEESFWIP